MANRYWIGGTGSWSAVNLLNWSTSSGGAGGATVPTAADTAIFDASSGGGTVTLAANTTVLTFSPSAFTGTINFNSNIVSVAGNATTVYSGGTAVTMTGTPRVNLTYAGGTGTRTITAGIGVTEANAVSFNVVSGSDIVSMSGNGARLMNLTFQSAFTGSFTRASSGGLYGSLTMHSGMSFTATANTITFAATTAQTITTGGLTVDTALNFNGIGGSWAFQDNLTMGSTRTFTLTAGTLDLNNLTLSTGLFNSNNSNVRTVAFGTGNITLTQNGTSIWRTDTSTGLTITGTPTVNLTYAGATGTRTITAGSTAGGGEAVAINLNVAAATDTVHLSVGSHIKNLTFTGFTGTADVGYVAWGNLTLSAGMTISGSANGPIFSATLGTTTITTNSVAFDRALTFNGVGGTFAFQDALTQGSTRMFTITAGTVQLKNGVTSTVGSFVANNANVKFLQSTTSGSQATLSQASGTVNVVDLTIRDINAAGGASWNAYADFENTDAGNNDGWNFSLSPPYTTAELPVTLRSFTQSRRF